MIKCVPSVKRLGEAIKPNKKLLFSSLIQMIDFEHIKCEFKGREKK